MSDSPATETPKLPKDLAAEKGLVNVQIDGHWIQVPRGTRMIEACKMAEVLVPHYCYHPKLSSPGNCRMCLVQMGMPPRPNPGEEPTYDSSGYQDIAWMPRPVIACANTVSENMGIRTTGDLVEKTRNGVMEFLLINHPLDCPICDQAGECRLQEFSVDHGKGASRFEESKVKKPKNVDIGARIRLDDERCIMCSRCIRFMDEVVGDPVLGFTDRGTHTTLTVHPGRRLDHNYSLNTADLCPVGALTSNDFRFKQRVWFLKETPSIDIHCGTGINTTIWTREGKIYRITPRQNDAVNSCWMPDSHRLDYHDVASDARLTAPLIKSAKGNHENAAWSEALQATIQGILSVPAEQRAIIASGRLTNEEWAMVSALAGELGVTLIDLVPRFGEGDGHLIAADRNANTNGANLVAGLPNPGSRLPEIQQKLRNQEILALLVIGEDLFEAAGFSHEELASLKFLGLVHHLANPCASAADVVLPSASFAEKRGTMINVTGRLQRLNAACTPPGLAREDWEILRDLITTADPQKKAEAPTQVEQVFSLLAQEIPSFEGLSFSKVGLQGVQVLETGVTIPLIEREKQRIAQREING